MLSVNSSDLKEATSGGFLNANREGFDCFSEDSSCRAASDSTDLILSGCRED
jgi:hypothetical protein